MFCFIKKIIFQHIIIIILEIKLFSVQEDLVVVECYD